MTLYVGPTNWWWRDSPNAPIACKVKGLVRLGGGVGSTLTDGSRIICISSGTAWIVAPCCTQVNTTWNNSTSTQVGNKCCICDWPTLNTILINCGFTPGDWFVPSAVELHNPGYVCRTQWDPALSCRYWSSTECNATNARDVCFGNCFPCDLAKSNSFCVRAFRCVTY
jgi:hypothetical protein